MRGCGRCHTCGKVLNIVLDGEEWCPYCKTYRRYRSHGWAAGCGDPNPYCPQDPRGRDWQLRDEN